MLTLADTPIDLGVMAVLFHLYLRRWPVLRRYRGDACNAAGTGVAVSATSYPFYCPRGEFRITYPDGDVCLVAST